MFPSKHLVESPALNCPLQCSSVWAWRMATGFCLPNILTLPTHLGTITLNKNKEKRPRHRGHPSSHLSCSAIPCPCLMTVLDIPSPIPKATQLLSFQHPPLPSLPTRSITSFSKFSLKIPGHIDSSLLNRTCSSGQYYGPCTSLCELLLSPLRDYSCKNVLLTEKSKLRIRMLCVLIPFTLKYVSAHNIHTYLQTSGSIHFIHIIIFIFGATLEVTFTFSDTHFSN